MATTTVDTSAPPLPEASTVAAANAATALVDTAVQPREMDATAATPVPRQVVATMADTSVSPPLEVSSFYRR